MCYAIRWIEADTRSLILCIAIIAIYIMIASVVSWFMQYQRILWFYHRMETFSPRQFTLRDAGHVSGDCNSSHLGNQSMIFLLFIPHLLLPIVGMLLYAKHPAQLSDCWPLTSGRVPAGIFFFTVKGYLKTRWSCTLQFSLLDFKSLKRTWNVFCTSSMIFFPSLNGAGRLNDFLTIKKNYNQNYICNK